MAKKPSSSLPPILSSAELRSEIEAAGVWFFAEFMEELAENYPQLRTKELKNQYIDYFYNCCFAGRGTKKDLLAKINTAIRIIESGLLDEALLYIAGRSGKEQP